ncbi:L-asparaginase isoform X2 [Agrilus planipennis]|nr:L-asparaginase isoform X2 [Agrilus planipennis]
MKNNLIYTIKEYDPLLDSSNMSIEDWQKIAEDIEDEYENFDGFVILHGTDTIAYTASALSFILEGLSKPVILTGSQIPIFEVRNDAKDNFLTSLVLSSCFDIREVCIYFSNKLFRGNRTRKVSSDLLEAFNSPNYHILADCGIDIKVYHQYLFKPDEQLSKLNVKKSLNPNVGIFYLFPTITVKMLKSFLKPPIEGIVLVSYGAGNIQSEREDLLEILKQAVNRGIIIINVTQCVQGTVNSSYATGQVLNSIGVLPGFDMTAEAALCKLSFVLGLEDKTLIEKKAMILKDLRGELSRNVNII